MSRSSAEHILERLVACGLKQKFAPAVLAAAAELLEPPASRESVIAEARQFFASRAGLIPHGFTDWRNSLPGGCNSCRCTWRAGKWDLS